MTTVPTATRPIHLPDPIDPNFRAVLIFTEGNPYPIYLPRVEVQVQVQPDECDKAKEPSEWPLTSTAGTTRT